MTPRPARNLSPVAALVLGWILPGAGHAYGGRWGKAVLFFVLITGLLVTGTVLGGGTVILPQRLWFAAQLGAGGPAIALMPVAQHLSTIAPIDWADPLHDIGTLYSAVAGFLNLLVMMDAYLRLAYPRETTKEDNA